MEPLLGIVPTLRCEPSAFQLSCALPLGWLAGCESVLHRGAASHTFRFPPHTFRFPVHVAIVKPPPCPSCCPSPRLLFAVFFPSWAVGEDTPRAEVERSDVVELAEQSLGGA